ncbi:MAG: guanylate kinase [Rhodobiaceae bacterium]|nr:guanylate kinase [Rhodobiaceae bacterium]MCC0041721.1 guanylate kinase [Rhodobiaceae bacterium]
MLVLSSPSGAGKTTISRIVLEKERDSGLGLSISATTRAKRPSEVEGTHYFFQAEREFTRRRDGGEFLEWAQVHGNYYATPREFVEGELSAGRDVLFDIDWQGAAQIRKAAPADMVSVFILPPSAQALRERLVRRAEDDGATISRRLVNARTEIAHWNEYDYVLVNHDVEDSVADVRAILRAERLRRARQIGLEAEVAGLSTALKNLD